MVPLKSLGTVSYSRAMVTGLIRVSSLCWRFVGYLYSVIIYLSSYIFYFCSLFLFYFILLLYLPLVIIANIVTNG